MTSPDTEYDPTENDWGNTYDAIERGVQHNIDGQSFASVRKGAWHKLGTVHDGQVDAETLLRSANADYDVFKIDLTATFTVPEQGLTLPTGVYGPGQILTAGVDSKVATARFSPVTGALQVLGVVGREYQILQNREAFIGFGDALVQTAQPVVSTCGVLFGGRQAFMCWKLPKGSVLNGGDDVLWWLLVRTSHDGLTKLTAAIVPLRTVCWNTMRYNLSKAIHTWGISHTRRAELNLAEAQTSLKLVDTYRGRFETTANALINTAMTRNEFDKIITRNFGPDKDTANKAAMTRWDNKRTALNDLFWNAETQAIVRGTAWAGVQAIGEYCDWQVGAAKTSAALAAFGGDVDAMRFYRSLTDDKSITRPKQAALKDIAAFADVLV